VTTKLPERRLVTIKRAAEYADCHVRTIERRIADGTLTRYGRGRMTRVDLNDVERWLKPAGAR
jgi:excisionase family DNA binding protein